MCMVGLLLSLATVLHCGAAAGVDAGDFKFRDDQEFLQWRSEFYPEMGVEELARIYSTWRENADYVQKANSLGLSYTLTTNKFTHLSRAEFAERNLQTFPHLDSGIPSSREPRGGDLPDSVDWRKKGVVVPVNNQGQCGSAIPFQIVGAIDSLHAIQNGDQLVEGSVEEFIDCCTAGGCIGVLYGAENYVCVVDIGGLALSTEYMSPDHKCLNDSFPPVIKIKGGTFLRGRNETTLAYAVARQPVVAAIDASHMSFQLYSSGVYYEPDCSSTLLDHVVLIVGYGSEDGQDYWICQNSWGVNWGMQGYIYMARNRGNNCGIATEPSHPD